jgi:Xaa-Pro aminopeptidase
MDVHDAGLYQIHNEPRRLEVGMAYTIEPGLYIPAEDASAPEELRGIGVRIEDNVVITAGGCEVMTSESPKEVADLEALVGRKA